MNIEPLREKASALGFSFERGTSKHAGYMLIKDSSGDRPLGYGYAASLKDIDRYLDSYAVQAGIDAVEIGNSEPRKPPLTKKEVSRALEGHNDVDKIKEVLNPPPSRKQAQRDRIALDRLFSIGMDARSAIAFDKLSEAEKEAHYARLRAVLEKEEQIKAASLPKPTIPFRTFAINSDHPFAKEEARRKREFWKADQRWRTNIGSRKDCENQPLNENEVLVPHHGKGSNKALPKEESLPPERGPYNPAPKAPSRPTLVYARPKLTSAEIMTRKAEAAAKQQTDDRQRRIDAITAEVRAKRRAMRKPDIGSLLNEMRRMVSPSEYQAWLRNLEIPELSARRWAAEG